MTDVVLVYPYFFAEAKDRSIFKYPPLGLGYLASSLRQAGFSVLIVDGSHTSRGEVVRRVREAEPGILGFYCMMTMEETALSLGAELKDCAALSVIGGPYPSADSEKFLDIFGAAVIGEGEKTIVELAGAVLRENSDITQIKGVAVKRGGRIERAAPRPRIDDIDTLPFPARDLFDNAGYKDYWNRQYGYTVASMMTTRGCPHSCGFCSKPVFGSVIKARSAGNVVEELAIIAGLGYDRVWMGDDCFTYDDARTMAICEEIIKRGLDIQWECLSRADNVNPDVLDVMRAAGCERLFFGLESADDLVLQTMKKDVTFAQGKAAIELAGTSGLKTGAFFILGYPGETNESLARTVNASSALPLDYLSYTVPYPLPGTDLYDKVKDRLKKGAWTSPRSHSLLYKGDFSIAKLKFAMGKGLVQHSLRKQKRAPWRAAEPLFRSLTDAVLRVMR